MLPTIDLLDIKPVWSSLIRAWRKHKSYLMSSTIWKGSIFLNYYVDRSLIACTNNVSFNKELLNVNNKDLFEYFPNPRDKVIMEWYVLISYFNFSLYMIT